MVAEAGGGVVIDHADGLHEGVADGGAHETEAAILQALAYGIGDFRGGREADVSFPRVLDGLAVYERPDVFVEGAEFFLNFQEGAGVGDGGVNFQAVADELSFTRAATRLRVAQSAVSAQIQDLETEVGVLLLERTRRRVRLTAAGQAFHEAAERILRSVQEASRQARRRRT